MTGSIFNFFLILAFLVAFSWCAPSRSKKNNGPDLIYDQKQTGDYNVQLHLKDFQIIAILGDTEGALGDYDYSYDYSDFTVKPSAGSPSTTMKISTLPSTTTSTTAASSVVNTQSTSSLPTKTYHHSSTVEIISSPTMRPIEQTPQGGQQQSTLDSEDLTKTNSTIDKSSFANDISPDSNDTSASSIGVSISDFLSFISSTMKPSSTEEPLSMTPGKIKVQILASPGDLSTSHTGLVPGEGTEEGDVLKRCAAGYSRDKKGRCKRVRRPAYSPQLPFGFSRLASNLASRLRLSPSQLSLPSSNGT
ncbi:mucin-5AC [Cylas formicarius]|uniref:mucin-5AC n=1 Tax=Cylas formicarius TaxID=197179 RepID=UPI0029585887|nr:mucin-5AC [Cylas formicarius]